MFDLENQNTLKHESTFLLDGHDEVEMLMRGGKKGREK